MVASGWEWEHLGLVQVPAESEVAAANWNRRQPLKLTSGWEHLDQMMVSAAAAEVELLRVTSGWEHLDLMTVSAAAVEVELLRMTSGWEHLDLMTVSAAAAEVELLRVTPTPGWEHLDLMTGLAAAAEVAATNDSPQLLDGLTVVWKHILLMKVESLNLPVVVCLLMIHFPVY